MAKVEINSEQLIPWCERRGIDAREIVADVTPPQQRRGDGIHYRLRRFTGDPEKVLLVEVVAPFDDPMPPVRLLRDTPSP